MARHSPPDKPAEPDEPFPQPPATVTSAPDLRRVNLAPADWNHTWFRRARPAFTPARVLVFVSDLHAGNRYGLCDPDFSVRRGGQTYRMTPSWGQLELKRDFDDFVARVNRWNPDTVVNLGDSTDGVNRKAPGKDRVFTCLDEQADMAAQLLYPLVYPDGPNRIRRRRKYICVTGSGYHGSLDTDAEYRIAQLLGQPDGFRGYVANIALTGTKSGREPFRGRGEKGEKLVFPEVLFNCSHGASQAFIYQMMLLDRESLHMDAAAAQRMAALPNYDGIFHGHWHHAFWAEARHRVLVINPCWKCFEPYGGTMKLYPKFAVPQIGGLVVAIAADGSLYHEFILYPAIHMSDALTRT